MFPSVRSGLRGCVKKIIGDGLSARIRLRRELRNGEPELALIPLLCDPRFTFVDVGANEGVYAFYARNSCRHVYALEPNPDLGPHLRAILKDRGTVLPLAASEMAGNATFSIPLRGGRDVHTRSSLEATANPGFDLREISVEMARLSDLDLGPVNLIKIDVEGHELSALIGARDLLESSAPTVIVECEERHNAGGVARVTQFFDGLGYAGHFLHRGRLRPAADFSPEELQRPSEAKQVNALLKEDYVNNFIFIAPSNRDHLTKITQGLAAAA